MARMLTQVNVNGIDVTSYLIRYEIERTYGYAINEATIELVKTISNVLSLETGQTIMIYRGWASATEEKVLDGYIESFNPDGGKLIITGKDKMWDLVRKNVNHTYDSSIDASAGKISLIFKDLVETYGGMNATVQDSGSGITIDKFVCNHTDIFERCKKLSGILDWQFYYNSNTNIVYFEPQGFTASSITLTIGGNVYQVPKWTYDNTELVNDLTVVGAYQEDETTETGRIGVTSGYTTTGITLTKTPISVKVYIDASNPPTTLKIGGLPDSTTTYDYYVDYNQKMIVPATGTTFTGNNYAEIRYSYAIPIPLHMYSSESITKYGKSEKIATYKDLKSVADAEERGTNYLLKYSNPFIYATLKVRNDSSYNLNVGQLIHVVDNVSIPNVDRTLLITKHTIRYPSDYDEVLVGDKAWRLAEWQSSVEERLKRIAEDELANQDITTELLTFDNTINYTIPVIPRYRKILTQSTISGEMIWGVGTWGTEKWSANAFNAETDNFIQQYENTYSEDFKDTDFEDTTNTTANWDTTNKQLIF